MIGRLAISRGSKGGQAIAELLYCLPILLTLGVFLIRLQQSYQSNFSVTTQHYAWASRGNVRAPLSIPLVALNHDTSVALWPFLLPTRLISSKLRSKKPATFPEHRLVFLEPADKNLSLLAAGLAVSAVIPLVNGVGREVAQFSGY